MYSIKKSWLKFKIWTENERYSLDHNRYIDSYVAMTRSMKKQQKYYNDIKTLEILKENNIKASSNNINFLSQADDQELALHILTSTGE